MRNNPLAKSDISKDELGSHPQPQLSTNLQKHKVAPWRAREGSVVFNHVDAVLLLTSAKRIHTEPKAHRLLGYGFATYGRGRYGRPHHQTWYGRCAKVRPVRQNIPMTTRTSDTAAKKGTRKPS